MTRHSQAFPASSRPNDTIVNDAPPFPVGSRVWLKRAQHGSEGTVVRLVAGKVFVMWPGLYRLHQHNPSALVLAAEKEEKR